MADLQAYKASETCQSRQSEDAPEEIPARYLCVSSALRKQTRFNLRILVFCRLRKVKMDQRKLMDNANTITDMAKVIYFYFYFFFVLYTDWRTEVAIFPQSSFLCFFQMVYKNYKSYIPPFREFKDLCNNV